MSSTKNLLLKALLLSICLTLSAICQSEASNDHRNPKQAPSTAKEQNTDNAKPISPSKSDSQPSTDKQANPSNSDTDKATTDAVTAWSTFALAFIGLAGTGAAVWTLITIKQQTTTIKGQLREMQSMGQQNERFIMQAVQQNQTARRMTEETRANAEAAKDNAGAAKLNAEALINAERAWVLVDIARKDSGGLAVTESNGTNLYLMVKCRNEGRSPAWIDSVFVKSDITETLNQAPDFNDAIPLKIGPWPLGGGEHDDPIDWFVEFSETLPEGITDVRLSVVYGIVKYRDIFGKQRETTFGYRINFNRRPERLIGAPRYNEHT